MERRLGEDPVRRPDRRRQQRCLVESERLELLAEEMTRSGGDAEDRRVPLLPQIHGVEIRFQDFLLGVAELEQHGDGDLARLPRPGPLSAQEETARQLLRDGAGASDDGGFSRVGQGGPAHRENIHSVVVHESTILGGDDGRHHRRRYAVQRDPDLHAPVVGRRDLLAVGVEIGNGERRSSGQCEGPPSPRQRRQAEAGDAEQRNRDGAQPHDRGAASPGRARRWSAKRART